MSTPSTDTLKQEIDQGRMRVGNPVQLANGANSVSSVSQISIDANSNLQVTQVPTVVQPTATSQMFTITGTGTTGILVNTLVDGATVTTATIGGYIRVNITNSGTGLTSGNYYLPVYTIV